MLEQQTNTFAYIEVERYFQEARYDEAITLLSQRVQAEPEDRMARLMLLLAKVLEFGAADYDRQIEDLRFVTELSNDERSVIQRIFLAGFHDAKQNGQTNRKTIYLRLIRQLMFHQPLDVSIIATPEIEWSNNVTFSKKTWRPAAAAATMIIVLMGLYVATERPARQAQDSSDPSFVRVNATPLAQSSGTAVILPTTHITDPAISDLLTAQLGSLNESYAQWSQSSPATRGTVALKLTVEPSGNVIKVDEVVSRLSDHKFLDAVIAEARKWKLPHGSTESAEISIPLMFVPGSGSAVNLAVNRETREPILQRKARFGPHTQFALEAEHRPAATEALAANQFALKPHTLGRLELATVSGPSGDGVLQVRATAMRQLAAASTLPGVETAISYNTALKHAPRFAADAIENVDLGTRVRVLRKERDWIKVKVQTSGNVGYLRKEYLTAFNTQR